MDCPTARAEASARLDGEADPTTVRQLDEHLRTCPSCRSWAAQAADVTRRLRLRPVVPAADLSDRVVARLRPAEASAWPAERWLLLMVGAVMLVFAIPMLGGAGGADVHLLREAGVSDLALATGVLFAAWQPWRSAGMLPVVVVLAAGLALTSLADVVSGRVTAVNESVHTLAPTAAFLLWRLRRRGPVLASTPDRRLRAVEDDERRSA